MQAPNQHCLAQLRKWHRHQFPSDNAVMDSNSKIDDFWGAVRPIIFVAQLFTLFPVQGVFGRDLQQIRFQWLHLRTLYSLTFLVLAALIIIAQINHTVVSTANTSMITSVLYYILNFSGSVCFLIIATKWRNIMLNWKMYEEVFLHKPYLMKGRSLKFKVRMVGGGILLLAFVEDLLHMLSCCRTIEVYIERCDNSSSFWETFYTREHSKTFDYISYSLPLALLLEFVHKVYLFVWTFMDVFISVVSIGLATRFEQLFHRIEHLKGKMLPESFWAEIRLDYTKISNLVIYMDGVLSPMIMITSASNIFFITYQLYMSVQLDASSMTTFYYRFSLLFLILRTLVMLLTSSRVYVASRKPLEILRAVPMSSWTTSVQRFTNEILNIENALSGHKFFFLKRGIILAMAGTMITYELVMLSEVRHSDNTQFCDGGHRLY
ncbi:AAEL000075-PA, partial [Aedes aegypti]